MIEHLVLFKFKDATSKEAKETIHAALRSLKTKVPGVLDLTVGPNFTSRNQGFTTGLCVRFRDKAALESYSTHPDHKAVVEQLIRPCLADLIAVDYEF